jgi:hypothetical protein
MELSPEQVQSINILLSAVQVAQRRGAFSLKDASTLQDAIDKLVPPEEQEKQAAEAAAANASAEEAEAAVSMPEPDVAGDDDVEGGDSEEEAE